MHPPQVKQAALDLIAAGHNDCEVSRRLGVPGGRSWTGAGRRMSRCASMRSKPVRGAGGPRSPCGSPTRTTQNCSPCISGMAVSLELPRTHRLRISLDTKYPKIIEGAHGLLERCFPENRVDTIAFHDGGCVNVSLYSGHLPCVLPQHGPGKKHQRKLVFEPWQLRIVDANPWPFIRGCIWTDGCAFINRTDVHRAVPYEYLSYQFSNRSDDIVWHVRSRLRPGWSVHPRQLRLARAMGRTNQSAGERGTDARPRRAQGVSRR